VAEAKVQKNAGVPDEYLAVVADALQKGCLFVPALKEGRPVEGSFNYRLDL
jgi:hypothetical protein